MNAQVFGNMEGLLNCPFCGGKPYFTKSVNGSQMNYVGCGSCGVNFSATRIKYDLESEMTRDIIKLWNTRSEQSCVVKCKCGNKPATEPHSCPFASEISSNDDPEYCTCCEDCEHDCAMDI